MSELAAMSNGSLSRLSHVVSRLERKGWVLRRPNTEDGRSTMAVAHRRRRREDRRLGAGPRGRVRDLVVDALTPEQLGRSAVRAAPSSTRIDARDGESCAGRPGRRPPA